MKTAGLVSAVVLLISLVPHSYAIKCYKCESITDFDGENNSGGYCFDVSSLTSSGSCTYCSTTFTIEDGVTTAVSRDCRSEVFPGEGWYTENDYSSSTTSKSEYYNYCSTDDCNKESASGLKTCSNVCVHGSCDYILGSCACNPGYKGNICNTTDTVSTATLKCHQCNSDYDDNCETEKSGDGDDCPNNENYCSISRTTVFDADGMIALKTVTTRGCTNDATESGCEFTNIHSDSPFYIHPYKEYTCYTTCEGASCNNGNSADVASDESADMYCVQCSGIGSCQTKTARSLCPSGTNFCSATVVYTLAERTGRHREEDPHYDLLSVDRGCATKSVPKECTEQKLTGASSVKKVTCSETCAQDGCNTGWPARPKCVICSDTDSCIEEPPFPESCTHPYQSYCYIQDEGIKKGTTAATSGYPRRMTRGCSHYDLGTSCTSSEPRETEIESCNRTCTTDGCNVGSGGEIPLQTLLYVLLVALSAILLQNIN